MNTEDLKNLLLPPELVEKRKLEAKVNELEAQLSEANAEIKYFEDYLLSADGHRCEVCGKVRDFDECHRTGDLFACSEKCKEQLDYEAEQTQQVHDDDDRAYHRWSNGDR